MLNAGGGVDEGGLGGGVAAVVREFGLGQGFGFGDDHADADEGEDVGGGATGFGGGGADGGDVGGDGGDGAAVEEDAFGVEACEAATAGGAAGLVEEGGALGRGFGQVDAIEADVRAVVVDGADAGRVGVEAGAAVGVDGVVGPAAFP